MKKIQYYLITLLAFIVGFNTGCLRNKQSTEKKRSDVVIIYKTSLFADSIKTVIAQVVKSYDSAYGLPYDTVIIDETIEPEYAQENDYFINDARAHRNTITFNKRSLQKGGTKKIIRNITAHELFHTLNLGTSKILANPIKTGWKTPYSKLVTTNGLSLGYTANATGGIGLIEEAAAEMFATYLYPDYIGSDYYYPIADLLGVIMSNSRLTLGDILAAKKSNDFGLFVSKIKGIPAEWLSNDDYMYVIENFIHYVRHPEKDPADFAKDLHYFANSY